LYAREVIKKLMVFARQVPPQKAKVNLNAVVEEAFFFLESRCTKGGIEVVRALAPNLQEMTADASQLKQVLVNLVVNAIQAMPNGGQLMVATRAGRSSVTLVVEDTGIGMTEEIREKIFLPFFTTKDVSEGTGLGLSVVHGIVNAHGGSIGVESQYDQGTRFEICLPTDDFQDNGETHGNGT
jgi:signal transduction histidine kinase